jgi:hypothetical protein
MRTFLFIEQNGNAVITLSAETYQEAEQYLAELVKEPNDFRVEDEEGEEE